MCDMLSSDFISYPDEFSSNESGMSKMQKNSWDKESPWKIPLLMLMLSDIKVPLSCVRVNCVFQFFVLCFRKPTTQEDLRIVS